MEEKERGGRRRQGEAEKNRKARLGAVSKVTDTASFGMMVL